MKKPKHNDNQLAKVIVELSTGTPIEESCNSELYTYMKQKNEEKKKQLEDC